MIVENIQNIRQRIIAACERVKRNPEEIRLIAVSKMVAIDPIRAVIDAGITDIGENYIQELKEKHEMIQDSRIRWHFIGHLQSNKVKYICRWIHLIHSVDSLDLGRQISRQAEGIGRTINILVEVNTSGEESKFGVNIEEAPGLVKELIRLPGINCLGLMTMGPFLPDPEESRPAFRSLKDLRSAIEDGGISLPELSMGMTNDFEVAIEEGATMVRIGTAIFGSRKN